MGLINALLLSWLTSSFSKGLGFLWWFLSTSRWVHPEKNELECLKKGYQVIRRGFELFEEGF
jgi:hypothetical protein